MKSNSQKNLLILSACLVVVMLGYGMVIPILPFYVEQMGAGGTELGLLVASYAIMRMICGPLWGSLSDRIGRKPVLMVGIFGYGITMVLFGLATKLWMLFLFRILAGILSSATSPTTMAYIGDSTPEAERSKGMGTLGAAVGAGTILGPGLGGLLASDNLAIPFFIAGGFSFLSLVLIAFLLPESLSKSERIANSKNNEIRMRDTWKSASSIGMLLGMTFLASFGVTVFFGIFGLYASQKFNAGPDAVGMIMVVFGIVTALAQGVLTGPLTQKWGERMVICGSLLLTAISFVLISISSSFPLFLAAIAFFTLAVSILTPAVSALISRVTTMEQGITMGLSNASQSLGRIVGPLLGGFSYDINLEYPNMIGAVGMGIGFLVSLWMIAIPNRGQRDFESK